MRYFLQIAYEGTLFHGWQAQPNTTQTIQGIVEDALTKLLRTPTNIVGSGRTDAGVHCSKQFAHFDTQNPIDTSHLKHRLNSFLPPQIAIDGIYRVQDNAHARFDATLRTYHYHLTSEKNPFLVHAHYAKHTLNIEAMNEAAQLLRQHTDFESFSKVKTDVTNFNCTITNAFWEKLNATHWKFTISANRFLRGMVRAIVGTLFLVGEGKLTTRQFEEIILAKDRQRAGAAAPARGLFLVDVVYPSTTFLDEKNSFSNQNS